MLGTCVAARGRGGKRALAEVDSIIETVAWQYGIRQKREYGERSCYSVFS
jgi:hypothetical protein